MLKNFGQNDSKIAAYTLELFQPEDEVLRRIREHQEKNGLPAIQVGGMDVRHLEILARLVAAQRAVEIGTLGGYSAASLVRGLAPSGKLYTFEFDPHHAKVAKESLEREGLSEKVEIFVGPALDNLAHIEKHGPFDVVFIDADKPNYPNYLAWAIENLRVGGIVIGDNTFAFGHITQDQFDDPALEDSVKALRRFNDTLAKHPNFRSTIFPTGEGLTVGVKIK